MEGTRRKGDLLGLINHGFEDLRVHMALVACGVAAEEVEVLAALDIVDIDSFAAVHSHRKARIVMADLC